MRDTVAARRYALSLFREARKKNELLACQQGLEHVLWVIRERPSVRQLLAHPFMSTGEKQAIVKSVLGEYATPLLETFMHVLLRQRRLALLEAIGAAFQEALDETQNVEPLKVRTAMPLDAAQQKALQERLEAFLKAKVRMVVHVDPQLIGGLTIETRNYFLDESLKGQLRRLQKAMVS